LVQRPLPHIPAEVPPALGVRHGQPKEQCREVAVALRPEDQVPVVRHQTVTQNPRRAGRGGAGGTGQGLDEDAEEGLVVLVVVE
jgi:hypothetical protein